MDVTQSSLGVRTRARTLALHNSTQDASFLQLRSRRLQKPPIPTNNADSKKHKLQPKHKHKLTSLPNPNQDVTEDEVEMVVEASFGENTLEFEGTHRSTRETTPSSLIRDPDTIETPGSTTRRTIPNEANRRVENTMTRHIPTAHETNEFFESAEKKQQQKFIKMYNYDPVKDMPLPGRYEWVKVDP